MWNRKVLVLGGDLALREMEPEGAVRQTTALPVPLEQGLAKTEDFFKIQALPKTRVLFLGSRGRLLANRPPYRLVEEGVAGLTPDPESERVLVWKKNALGILDFTAPDGAGKETETARLTWIAESKGGRITQGFWAHGGSHALFRNDGSACLLELAPGAGPEAQTCLEIKRGSSVLYREPDGRMYFIEKDGGHFSAVTLVQKTET